MRCTVERVLALVSTRMFGSCALAEAWGLEQDGVLAERRVGAQQPQAGAGHRREDLALGGLAQRVVAVAEEGEVVVGHPAQEADGERGLVGVDALRRGALELGGQHQALAAHLRPVLDRLPHVLEHVAHGALEQGAARLVALAVDRQQHPRLGQLADGDA